MKTVLISGTSSGIGKAAAQKMLASGWRVYGSVRKAGDAQDLTTAFPATFHELVFDVTDADARRAGVAMIQQNGHALHALVNNAGIAVSGPLERLPEADYRRQFEVNVFGLIGLTQDSLPLLHAAKEQGISPVRIVNISSVSGLLTSPFTALYSASKFAVESLTDGFRRELLPFGIDVVSVAPGPVKTPIWKKGLGQTAVYENSRYAFVLDKLPRYIANAEASAIPAARIADRIYEVLQAERPKPYHLMIPKAWLMKLLSRLPKRRFDKMVWKNLDADKRY
ncbi:MAG: SDR family oxidoreductase [Bacteroidota bacterium]